MKSAMVRWPIEPTPGEAKLSCPGRALAYSTNSFSVDEGTLLLQPSAKGFVPTMEIGAKSLIGS